MTVEELMRRNLTLLKEQEKHLKQIKMFHQGMLELRTLGIKTFEKDVRDKASMCLEKYYEIENEFREK